MYRTDRFFDPDPSQRSVARTLYDEIRTLPLICPHGHVDPQLFADPDYDFGSPTQLLIIPDHYVFRMLYSQGISLNRLGIPRRNGEPVERDHRKIWQTFADHYHLFGGTPTGVWLNDELHDLFEIEEKLNSSSAPRIYDQIAERLTRPDYRPRALFERFNIEVLCTTDAANDPLIAHQQIRSSDWHGVIRPTFRPDSVINLAAPGWQSEIERLGEVSGIDIVSYTTFIEALEKQRAFFQSMGATATDQGVESAEVIPLSALESEALFKRALSGRSDRHDAHRFSGHMLLEMARMSAEDGLVMQLHVGSYRNHNTDIFAGFGKDMGADIPTRSEFTRSMQPLFERFGNSDKLRLILFNLDESTYSRELAPLAGHYPILRLGPPWWFHDSLNGIRRYFDRVVETAGIYNTVGFNDDTRAYPSIPARHDLWRRAAADWVAGLVVRGIVDDEDGAAIAKALAYDLAKEAYRL